MRRSRSPGGTFVSGQGKYLGLSGKYGYLGVDIFFVISGFVIPWSLYRAQYALQDYPRFLLKRNVRLYPPYLASIAVTVLATNFVISPVFHQARQTITAGQLLAHFAYLNDLLHLPWVNVAYSTLAIELQWYLLVGLMFPLLTARSMSVRFAGLAGLMTAYFMIGNERLIFHSIPIFLVGVLVFQYRVGLISSREMLVSITVIVLAMLGPTGWIVAAVSLITGLLIAFPTFQSRAMDQVGDVSYSLYLLHLPIGVGVITCLSNWLPHPGRYLGVIDAVALLASGLAAWIMYQMIEKPSQEMSSAIRFAVRQPAQESRSAVVATAAD